MNTNASRIQVTTGSALSALAPAKVQPWLNRALERNLTVWQNTTLRDTQGWTIESPNPVDDWQLWLFFEPSTRGGRLTITRYTPSITRKANSTKLTRVQASVTIDNMGDGLDRYHEREAAKARRNAHAAAPTIAEAEAALRQVGRELDGAVLAPEVTPATADTQARETLSTLRVNGRFAIRMARTGAIPRSTTGTVRLALVNRDLVSPSGVLTGLGREVRKLILEGA